MMIRAVFDIIKEYKNQRQTEITMHFFIYYFWTVTIFYLAKIVNPGVYTSHVLRNFSGICKYKRWFSI